MSKKEIVYQILRSRKWITSSELRAQAGENATSRLRELRTEGYDILSRRGDGEFEYRMTRTTPVQ